MSWLRVALLLLLLLVASWLQAGISSRIEVFHAQPDFVLTTLVCICITIGTYRAAFIGVWAGFLTAVLAGYNYGSILVSRVLTATFSGLLQQHVIQDSPVIPPIVVFTATWISEGLYFLMAPNLHNVHWWLLMVFRESLYNAILSVPIYFGIRALGYGAEVELGYNPYIETL